MALEAWFGAWRGARAEVSAEAPADTEAAVLEALAAEGAAAAVDDDAAAVGGDTAPADPSMDRAALEAAARRLLEGFAAADADASGAHEPRVTRFTALTDARGFLSRLTADVGAPADLEVFRRQRWSLLELPRLLGVDTATVRAWRVGLLLPPSEGIGLAEDHHRARLWPNEVAPFFGRGSLEAWARRVVDGHAPVLTWHESMGAAE
jgi:hypothetical protein